MKAGFRYRHSVFTDCISFKWFSLFRGRGRILKQPVALSKAFLSDFLIIAKKMYALCRHFAHGSRKFFSISILSRKKINERTWKLISGSVQIIQNRLYNRVLSRWHCTDSSLAVLWNLQLNRCCPFWQYLPLKNRI